MTEHLGSLENEFGTSEWRATCSCGYSSPLCFSSGAAEAMLDMHYKGVETK